MTIVDRQGFPVDGRDSSTLPSDPYGGQAIKAPCRVATTANITLAGLQTIDGITVAADDRVLVKNQSTASQNGIYVAASGNWTRSIDADGAHEIVHGTAVLVTQGTINGSAIFGVSTVDPIVIGTTSIAWINLSTLGIGNLFGAQTFSSKAQAEAAQILAATTHIVIAYPQGDMHFDYTASTPSHLGYFTTSGGRKFVATGVGMAPEFLGVTYDGTTDDTIYWNRLAVAANAVSAISINCRAGSVTSKILPNDSVANAFPVVMTFTSLKHLVFNCNGMTFSALYTGAITTEVIRFDGCLSPVVNGFNGIGSLTNAQHTAGAGVRFIRMYNGTTTPRISGMRTTSGLIAVCAIRTPGDAGPRCSGGFIDAIVSGTYYGFSGQFDWDNVNSNFISQDCERTYYIYGNENHVINVHSKNNLANDILLVGFGDLPAGEKATTGHKIKYTNKGSTTVGTAIFLLCRPYNASAAAGTIQAEIEFDVDLPDQGSAFIQTASYSSSNVTLGDAGHTLDVTLRGRVTGNNFGQFVELATAAQGWGNTAKVHVEIPYLDAPDATGTFNIGVGTLTRINLDNVYAPLSALTPDGAYVTGNLTAENVKFSNLSAGAYFTDTVTVADTSFTYAKLQLESGLTLLGNPTNSSAHPQEILGSANQIMRVGTAGTSLGFGSINLASSAAVGTSILSAINGGSGIVTNNVVFRTKAAAQAATINTSAVKTITLTCQAVDGDSPAATYGQVSASESGSFTTADGQNWGILGRYAHVRWFDIKCDSTDGTDGTDDTSAFQVAAGWINMTGSGLLEFPRNKISRIWPTGSGSGFTLFSLNSPQGVVFLGNGTRLLTPATSMTGIPVVIEPTGSWRDIRVYDLGLEHVGMQLTVPDPVNSGALFYLVDNGENFFAQNVHQIGGIYGLTCVRTGTTQRTRNITINGAHFNRVFYPLSFQKNGDNFTGTGIVSENHGRFFLPKNVHNHFLRATVKEYGNVQPGALVLTLNVDASESAELNTISDIDVGITSLPVATSNAIIECGLVLQQAVLNGTANGTMRNIRVRIDSSLGVLGSPGVGFKTYKLADSGGIGGNDLGARGYVVDNIDISGTWTGNGSSFTPVSMFESGLFAGENVSNIRLHDIVTRTIVSPGGDDVVVDASSITNLILDDIKTTNGIAVTNVAAGALQTRALIPGTTFSVNGTTVTAADTISGRQLSPASTAPATPPTGYASRWVDSADKVLKIKDDAGTISLSIVPSAATSNNFMTGITSAGLVTRAQPSFTNISGSVAASQMPALTGDITTSAGAVATTLATVNSTTGTFGSATKASVVTVNAKGLVTVSSEATVTPAVGSISGLGSGVATWLATPTSANLRGALTDETGTGAAVFADTPTLLTPLLGTPTSGTLTNCTGLPISTGVSGLGSNVAAFLATPSSANLRAAITDETGTGAAVFGTSPTITTSLTISGAIQDMLLIVGSGAVPDTAFSVWNQGTGGHQWNVISSSNTTGNPAGSGGLGFYDGTAAAYRLTISSAGATAVLSGTQGSPSLSADTNNVFLAQAASTAQLAVGAYSGGDYGIWLQYKTSANSGASGNIHLNPLGGSIVTGASVATNATDGFLYIPTCAGTPTGVPTAQTGTVAMVYDTTNNKFYIYNGAWKGGATPGAFT